MVAKSNSKELVLNYFDSKAAYDEYKTSPTSDEVGEVNVVKDTVGGNILEIRGLRFNGGTSSVSSSGFTSPDGKFYAGLKGDKGYNYFVGSPTNVTIDAKVIGANIHGKNITLGPKAGWSNVSGSNINVAGSGVVASGLYVDAQGNNSFSAVGGQSLFPIYLRGEAGATQYILNTGQILGLFDIPAYLKGASFKYKQKSGTIIEGKIVDVVPTDANVGSTNRGSKIYNLVLDKTLEPSIAVTDQMTKSNFKVYPAQNKGTYSVLFGANRTAGTNAFAAGSGNIASGVAATAFGYGTYSKGVGSFTSGFFTRTANDNESAFGIYNTCLEKGTKKSIFDVGCGDINRHQEKNAISITEDGSIYIKDLGGYLGNEDEITSQKSLQEVITEYGALMGELIKMVQQLSQKQN